VHPGKKMFYEPSYKSCTKLIATVASEKFGFDIKPLEDLIYWGDMIDGAQFPSPQFATAMAEPALQLALVIEAAPENGIPAQLIPDLAYRPLAEMVRLPIVAKHLTPLLDRHRKSIEILRARSEAKDGVIFFDVADLDLEGYNKFVPYYLHPESVYSVGLSKSSFRVKVSVGSNPWAPHEPEVNLARICERYGGGGHARVGAISFNVDQHAAAIKASQEIVAELRAAIRQKKS
jgi:hypothetical protein